jgi:DNA-binding beta-propeller fold protein YncE
MIFLAVVFRYSALLLLVCAIAPAQKKAGFTSPLPTGLRLDPVGDLVDLGSMPVNLALSPDNDTAVVVLSGWREQGVQVIDLKKLKVTQTLLQDGAFYGAVFSPDGRALYVSGGNTDSIFVYSWQNGAATLRTRFELEKRKSPDGTGLSYPAGMAISKDGKFIYAAEDVGDRLAVINAETGVVVQRFPTDHYPFGVALTADGDVFVSAWSGNTVSAFHSLQDGTLAYVGRIQVGRHPSAMASSGTSLYVALAGSDRVAVLDTKTRTVTRYLQDSAPGAPHEGSTPCALAVNSNGTRLFVAESDNNALAVFDAITGKILGRIPTDWYPTAVVPAAEKLLVLTGKGHGTHANPDGPVPLTNWPDGNPTAYTLGQLNGTLRTLPTEMSSAQLAGLTRRTAAANNWQQSHAPRHYPPFHHVLYIIKENRTYDQVLGDMKDGDGDPGLVYFGESLTPNHHALARRFGLFDRFFVNAEVSSQGHIWSTAAYVTDYGEKTIPSAYAGKRPDVDGEEAGEPERGFLWTLALQNGISFRDYGEMVKGNPGWPVTQRELTADVNPDYPPFDLTTPDQKRADVWIDEFKGYVRDGNMPRLEVMWLPNDHLAAGRPGKCTPRACMSDNDLALGRIVQALSHSPYWKDTVIFVLEDDSQAGPDHVDSHRSPFFAISAYNRPGTIHRFVNTTDVIAAIEDILKIGRLSKFDYFSRPLTDVFAASPDLTPYDPVIPQQDLNEKNPQNTAAARLSEGLDFSRPDRVDDQLYNGILWLMMKGDVSLPAPNNHAELQALESR